MWSDRCEDPRCVGHDVADDVGLAGYALALECRRRALVGTEEDGREPVHLDPDVLLGHGEVAAPEAGLDMAERDARRRGGTRARQRRVRVAVDEDEGRRLGRDRSCDGGHHRLRVRRVQVEAMRWLRKTQLREEHVRQLAVVVLPGVDDDLLDPGVAECDGQGRGLDELRAVPDDGEQLHERKPRERAGRDVARCARSTSGEPRNDGWSAAERRVVSAPNRVRRLLVALVTVDCVIDSGARAVRVRSGSCPAGAISSTEVGEGASDGANIS